MLKIAVKSVSAALVGLLCLAGISSASITAATAAETTYTLADVATHNTKTNCWTIVDKIVYNITPYIPSHPGGSTAIARICGIDGTAVFTNQHGTTGTQKNILATYKIGILSTDVPVTTAPSAPLNLTAQSITSNSFTLGWAAPTSNGGTPITNYLVEISSDSGVTWTAASQATNLSTSLAITNLLPAKRYDLRVRAANAQGLSSYSQTLVATTLALVVPNSPSTATYSKVTSISASVAWTPVTATPKVNNYLVDISTDGLTWTPALNKVSTMTNLLLAKLLPGTNYKLRVAAVNQNGTGPYLFTEFTTLALVPSTPTALTGSNITSSGLVLNWSAPLTNGGATITDYSIEIDGGGFLWQTLSHAASSATSINVTGLSPATKYSFRVKALNSVGFSKVSKTLALTTSPTAPQTPTALVAKTLTATSAAIAWAAPATGGSKITEYQIQYSLNNGLTWLSAGKSTTTSFTIKSLTTKTTYQTRVTAVNIAGSSQPSQGLSFSTK